MTFDFKNFGSTSKTSLTNNSRVNVGNGTNNVNLNQEQPYSGLGSSVTNFGKDIAQGLYLAFGGQKNIDENIQQYLDNAATLTHLATQQQNPELKKKYITLAEGMIDDAKNVGGKIIGDVRSPKQIISDALGTLGWTLVGGTPTFKATSSLLSKSASTVSSRIAFGTAFGAGAGAQGALSKDQSGSDIVKQVAIGGATGFAVSGIMEGIGAGLRSLAKTNTIQQKVGNIYNTELQPPTKELASDIERRFKTIGDKIAQQVDANGKPIYIGNYNQMQTQAENQIKQNSQELRTILNRFMKNAESTGQNLTTNRIEVEKYVLNNIQDYFGVINRTDKNTIAREVAKLPETMNLIETLDNRILVDRNISSSFWLKLGTGDRTSFVETTRYLMRDFLKTQIENQTNSEIIKNLNGKISIALDLRHLTALQKAIRINSNLESSRYLSLGKIVGAFLDSTVFSPQVRTRYAQSLNRAGQKTGGILIRNAITDEIVNKPIQ